MAARPRGLPARLLRGLAVAALAALGVLGVAITVFPFDRLGPALSARIDRETGVAVRFGDLRPTLGVRGVGLEARNVALRFPDGETLALDIAAVRPARLGAWLRGVPTARVALRGDFGEFSGEVSREALRGTLARFDLAELPRSWFGEGGAPLAGPLDGRVDFERGPDAWRGSVAVAGAEGSLALPGSPVAIPYERIDASARLDEHGTLHLESIALAGPMVSARATGTLGGGTGGPATGAIAITADVERVDPALLPSLAQYGVALDASGAGHLEISGTAQQIEVR
jgi:type II secretion system protein N